MAGIYLHIPFCRQACHYCDFHFSTNTEIKSELIRAMVDEISLQKNYLRAEPVNTIYFGGGTPSLLEAKEIGMLLEAIHKRHPVSAGAEITIETNPDDLTEKKLKEIKALELNR